MYHGDLARSGVSTTMPTATGSPRVARSIELDAAVYASPIVGGSTIFVATENNTVYAYTTDGSRKWSTHLGSPSPGSERPCGNIDPLGITGTPVYDASSSTVFVSPEYGGPPRHELVALNATTGDVRWHRSIDLPGADPTVMQQRGALTITGGRVWTAFGGLAGDCGPYKGRVVGVPIDGTGSVLSYTVPTTREAGIWTPPGPVVDASGDMFVAVGNGESGPGDPYDYSDSVLRIGPSDAKLRDSFSPTTWPTDNAADLDLGSQGPALVGSYVFQAGKSGTAYVLGRDHLGGIGGQVSQKSIPCHSYGGTAVKDDIVYAPCTEGVTAIRVSSTGEMTKLWTRTGVAGSPVIGGGRIWALDAGGGRLYALNPSTGNAEDSVSVGTTTRFATPALFGNLALIGTMTGLTIVTTS